MHRMKTCWSVLLCGSMLTLLSGSPAAAQTHKPTAKKTPAHKAAPRKPAPAKTPEPVDMQALQTQVMLDRAGYSPGEIDGTMGASTKRALDAYTKNGGKTDTLPADAVTPYKITEQDAAGPFVPVPEDMMEKAKLSTLGYSSLPEALGERFHSSPALLKRMNPTAKFVAGEEIQVPNVAAAVQPSTAAGASASPAPTAAPAGSPAPAASASPAAAPSPVPTSGRQSDASGAVTVTVRKSMSDLVVQDATGRILMYAPVTTGSEHDPLPIGEWKVTGVQKEPKFHYNPDLFWDAEPTQEKATIPPGPNNPVGVVWVDISRPHYGLHGTPEPSTVGKTTSHGCVRLTNWDVMRLASLVKPGTKVVFAE
jgi:lipoprotein-anchoring transpeptidase ErfK/SrfK